MLVDPPVICDGCIKVGGDVTTEEGAEEELTRLA